MAKGSGDSEVTQEETPRKGVCRGGGGIGWVDHLHQHQGQWEQKPEGVPESRDGRTMGTHRPWSGPNRTEKGGGECSAREGERPWLWHPRPGGVRAWETQPAEAGGGSSGSYQHAPSLTVTLMLQGRGAPCLGFFLTFRTATAPPSPAPPKKIVQARELVVAVVNIFFLLRQKLKFQRAK